MEDKLKFKDSVIFKEYKEEIEGNKERYKAVLLELLEENRINSNIYMSIIKLWEKSWKEEPHIYIDKLKFDKCTFKNCKEEIINNKDRYKPALLKVLEEDKINSNIKKEILEIWEDKWKEGSNEYITKLTIEIDKAKFNNKRFEEYKEEIRKNKERYKPALLKALEENKIDWEIYKEIIELWEKDWGEKPIIKLNKKIINLDKWKFYYGNIVVNIFNEYKREIANNKERYKSVLLELLDENEIDDEIYKDIIDIWENEWKEEANVYIDTLKFDKYIFKYYKEEITNNKDRYKPILLELLEKDKIYKDIYKEIIDIWDKEWREVPNIYIDKLKFHYDYKVNIFKEYKKEISKDKERYKPILLELIKKNRIDSDIYEEMKNIWEKEWKEEGEIEGKIELIYIDNVNYFIENKDEIINNREKYEVTVRRFLSPVTYKKIKPILNSWGDSDIELLTKLLLKSTYRLYNTLYSELKDELIENRENIMENISKNYKAESKDKTVKLFILSTIQTIEELEEKLKLLKIKDMDKLVEYLIKLDLDKDIDIDSEVLENIVKIVTDKISEIEYIKLFMEIKKSKDNISTSCIGIFKNIFEKIETKDNFDSLIKEFGFNNPIKFLKYLKDNTISPEATMGYCKLLKEYYSVEIEKIALEIGEGLLEKFDGSSYENCVKYSKNRDILDSIYNYEDIMKFNITIENGRYLNKKKIFGADIEYSKKEKIKIAYWSSYKPIKKLSKVEEYIENILPKNKKYINYEIDSLGFNNKKERYFRYNDNNIVVKLKDRKLQIFNSSGKEIKRLSSTSEDFYTVRTLENIKELKKMVKNIYTDGDNGIKKEYCNNVLRDYDLWREIYIDNILLQEYTTNLIWEEVDSDDNVVGRFRYVQDGEFCDSNDDEYTINKKNRIRLLSLDKVSDDEVDRWIEQLNDYEIVQPVPQLELYNIDYSDIDPKNIEISNNEIELGKLEKNKIGLELKFKDEEMYFEVKDILKIELEDKIKWTKYKTLSKDTIVKISRINLLNKSDYSLRMVKLLKDRLGI